MKTYKYPIGDPYFEPSVYTDIPYYMIANNGMLMLSPWAKYYRYHLILAQQWIADQEYRQFVRNMREKSPRMDVILDNGAHEGIVIDPEEYLDIAIDLQPNCVVLPDLIGEPALESRKMSMGFMGKASIYMPRCRWMYVPQGASKYDIMQEFKWATEAFTSANNRQWIIGLGQSYLTWETDAIKDEEARSCLIEEICKLPHVAGCQFHILGGRWNPKNWVEYLGRLNLVGMDSVKPCTCALAAVPYPIKPDPSRIELQSFAASSGRRHYGEVMRFCKLYGLDIELLQLARNCMTYEESVL